MRKSVLVSAALLLLLCLDAFAGKLSEGLILSLSNPDGLYRRGEKVKVYAELRDVPAGVYNLKTYIDGVDKGDSTVDVKGGKALVFSARYGKPVSVILQFSRPGDPKDATSIGFVVGSEGFTPGYERPEDFDTFWQGQVAKLRELPRELKLTEVPLEGPDAKDYVCYDFELNCLGGKPVIGYLAYLRNAASGSLPIFMLLKASGVSGRHCFATPQNALNLAKRGGGAIGLDINAHGMPNAREQSFYEDLEKGELKGYWNHPVTDLESYYFRGMILREQRALDYLCTMPQWDGKRVLLHGQSQGAYQVCALAGLDPRVSAATIVLPAGLDTGGYLKGRRSAWPRPDLLPGQDPEAALALAPYFDCAQFLKGCRAEFHVELGLIDFTCPASGCFAALNGVAGKKTIMTDPYRPHGNVAAPYMKDWQDAQNIARTEWVDRYLK